MTTEGSVITGTPAAPATGGPAPTPAPAWHETIEPEAAAWAKTRGYKLDDPTEAAKHALVGHYNAEKLIGLDRAGRTVVLPKDDATADEITAFRSKLGVPADAKGYKLPEAMKDDPMAQAFAEYAHKEGYTPKQLQAAIEFVNAKGPEIQAAQAQERELKAQADVTALRGEWGGEFELRSEAARRAVRELGLSTEEATAIEETLGVGKAAKLFFQIGKGLMEDRPEGMAGANGGGGKFGLTSSEAKGRIQTLQKDPDFTARVLRGDTQAKAEWDRLHQVAFGGA